MHKRHNTTKAISYYKYSLATQICRCFYLLSQHLRFWVVIFSLMTIKITFGDIVTHC